MIDIAMSNGDLIASTYGDMMLNKSDDDNVIQMANSAICTIKGENIFHPEYGNDMWNMRLKISESGFDIVKACIKDAILNSVDEVAEVVDISAERGSINSECIISYALLTVDNRTVSSNININIL